MKCELCKKEITSKHSHNGDPLVKGRVCSDCNWKVIRERLKKAKEATSTESIAVTGTDGPVNTTDPMADFERYAKKFEETFILGSTPVRKEKPENRMKVDKDGNIVGEIDSMVKPEKMDQVKPLVATEGIKSYNELSELLRLCKEIGLKTFEDLNRFVKENPSVDTLTALREYRKELGDDFKIKE